MGKPRWLIDQRYSRHGADFGYNLDDFNVEAYYKRYCEALTAVDDNLGRLLNYLETNGILNNTLLVYMGDNGFQFGEHGLIDKRTAYEASIRVPLLMHYPDGLEAGKRVSQLVANIDIAPTLLEAAGASQEAGFDGQSFWSIARGISSPWRSALLYEYYWEWNYPQTPTVFAVRGDRFKFIRYHGIWDTDELYDIQNDSHELNNLITDPAYVETAVQMKKQLYQLLTESKGLQVPILPDRGRQFYNRHPERASPGNFPKWFYDKMEPVKN